MQGDNEFYKYIFEITGVIDHQKSRVTSYQGYDIYMHLVKVSPTATIKLCSVSMPLWPDVRLIGTAITFMGIDADGFKLDEGKTSGVEAGAAYYFQSFRIEVEDAAPLPADKPSDWAEDRVNWAVSLGLVPSQLQSGYTNNISRQEFCALAVALYETYRGTPITERKTFNDTNDINIEKLAGLGIVGGVGNNNFNPSGTFDRESAAYIFVGLLKAMGINLPIVPTTFSDADQMASWTKEPVGQAQAAGLIGGVGNNTFAPKSILTRETGILFVLNLWNYLKG